MEKTQRERKNKECGKDKKDFKLYFFFMNI